MFDPNKVYIFEIFSGHGSVSRTGSIVLGQCMTATLDLDARWNPTFQMSIDDFGQEHAAFLKTKFEGKRPIIWASPPCEEYSRAKTRGKRKLDEADDRVRKVFEIADMLDPLVILVENPATGLLANDYRHDMLLKPYTPNRYVVHYCQYGKAALKPTMIWSSIDLESFGFEALTCPGGSECHGMYKCNRTQAWKHVAIWDKTSYENRISVPDQLVISVFRAVQGYLDRCLPKPHAQFHSARNKTQKQIDLIHRVKVDAGKIMLKVDFRGQDRCEWIFYHDDMPLPLKFKSSAVEKRFRICVKRASQD